MLSDLRTLKEDPVQYEKAVTELSKDPGMQNNKLRNVDSKAEWQIKRMVSNLLWLHDQVPAEIRDRSKLWYDGAQKIATRWADKWDKTRTQTAGMLAALSPQKDWFMNTTMAERVGDILHDKMGHTWDRAMTASAFKFLTGDAAKSDPDAAKNTAIYEQIKGKTLSAVIATGDKRAAGIWIRAYDEAHHDTSHAIITPEGSFAENKRTAKGEEARRAWGDFTAIGKAASIYVDGSLENVSANLGGEHKVRNFYNNIFNAKDARFITIDTHAVAAAQLRPLAGADKAVADNFGKTGGTNLTGISGSYPLYFEAYQRAAAERGLLGREMQSITWEAIRGLYTEGFKTAENKAEVDKLWRQVDAGKLSVDQAREQLQTLSGGINNPDWWNSDDAPGSETLRDKTYDQQRAAHNGAKVTFEVAPDPRNTELKAKWDALPGDAKQAVSHRIAWNTAMSALNYLGIKAELHQQLGGWMADSNPSLALWLDKNTSGSKAVQLSQLMGYALNQEGMMVTSLKKFPGANEGGAVLVSIPNDYTNDQIHALYTEIRTGTIGDDGQSLVNGHSSGGGYMAILNDESKIGTHPLALKVAELLGDRHGVENIDIFVSFPEKGENDYGLSGQDNSGGIRKEGSQSSLGAYADRLRAEASAALESALDDPGTIAFSNKPDGRGASAQVDGSSGPSARPNAVTVSGVHFSGQALTSLDGRYNGRGLKGAEAKRLAESTDSRIKERVYFYVDEGSGIRPESGVGAVAHTASIDNLYNVTGDPQGLFKSKDDNANESALLDAGYNGYYVPKVFNNQGVAVVLGNASRGIAVKPSNYTKGQVAATPAQPYKRGLTSKELNAIDLAAVQAVAPSAKLRMGTFTVDQDQLDVARAELAKQGVDLPDAAPVFSNKSRDLNQDIVLTIPVDDGTTAKMTVNAQTYISQLDAREDALQMVKECMV